MKNDAAELKERISLVITESNALRQDRAAFALEAACTTALIQDMKKDAATLEEQINRLKS
jgi:predicted nuclease with TOPRIM domain